MSNEKERVLASIEKVENIRPIPDADAIEVASIKGWNIVVKKGEFKEGDLCVYCEIDSVLPMRPEFEFLANKKYRIKTIKLRGQVSQGIAFPLSIIPMSVIHITTPEGPAIDVSNITELGDIRALDVGTRMDDVLGITKYEEPIPAELAGKVEGRFPSHTIKTDEERVQNLKKDFDRGILHQYTYTETEKLDGSSSTFYIYDNVFGVASRNLALKETEENSFWKVARRENIEEIMRELMGRHNLDALSLQAELIGEGIQKNRYRLKGQDVRFFRAFLPMRFKFLEYDLFLDWMSTVPLKTVPIVNENFVLPEDFDELVKHVDGPSKLFQTAREGSVFVANNSREPQDNGRYSFKVISNKFILKHNL